MSFNIEKSLKALRQNPQKVIDNARKGDLLALRDLGNLWLDKPEMLSMGLIDMWYFHLSKEPPTDFSRASYERTPNCDRAFMSLVGLSKLVNVLRDGHPYEELMLQGWPALFKWSVFMIASRVKSRDATPESVRSTSDIVCGTWYSVSRTDSVRHAMVKTKGTIEMATHLWVNEDLHANPSTSIIAIPTPSACLDAMLFDGIDDYLDRVVKSSGGDPEKVVKLAMSRLKTALNAPKLDDARLAIYLDLIGHLSRKGQHPLRNAFLAANIITITAKVAVSMAQKLNAGGPDGLTNVLVASLGYLSNFLESTDGFTWIIQALNAGMLLAWVDASPHFKKLDPYDYEMINRIVEDIVPRYLVYRSVINAVDGTMKIVDDAKLPHRNRVRNSIAKDIWSKFLDLAVERRMVALHASVVKNKTCDNVKCQKIDARNNFQKCAGCQTTLYCSKACQTVAWKEGGHRSMCKLKQQERREGKLQSITKSDSAFFHALATRDASRHLPFLQRLAQKEHPNVKHSDFIICIDYTVLPPKYSLSLLANYEKDESKMSLNGSTNAEARNDTFVERARQHPGKFTLIQSRISNGTGMQLVTSVITGNFWQGGDDDFPPASDSEEDDMGDSEREEYRNRDTNVDEVDFMRARLIINSIAASLGQTTDL